jgi:hypothetical protein
MSESNPQDSSPRLAEDAERLLQGELPPGSKEAERDLIVDEWLRWSQSDEIQARKQWVSLTVKSGIDRDDFVLRLWRSIENPKHKNNRAKGTIEEEVPWEYYQRHFFGWFLGRFDLRAARGIFVAPWLASLFHWSLVVIISGVSLLSLENTLSLNASLHTLGWIVGVVCLIGFASALPDPGVRFYAYFNSLIPRLGAAIGIGYLFLFSAPQLVQMLNVWKRPEQEVWFAAGLLTAALLYLTFHISRRVYPRLSWRLLFTRSASILALAVAYSLLELLIAAPVLFSVPFICGLEPKNDCVVNSDLPHLLLGAAIALNLGVILQLAWDEKPLTEPL